MKKADPDPEIGTREYLNELFLVTTLYVVTDLLNAPRSLARTSQSEAKNVPTQSMGTRRHKPN